MASNLEKCVMQAFATHYHLLIKAQNFHWNVTGPLFLEYHKLFGEIYEGLESHVDDFAESIRSLGYAVPVGLGMLKCYSSLCDAKSTTIKNMVDELLTDSTILYNKYNSAIKVAEQSRELAFSNYLIDREADLKKYNYKLLSTTK